MIGRMIDGKYRVDRRLAAGGFGTVFVATQMHAQTELGTVVLKFLHSELAHDPRISKRFVTEARAARELTNPHVVRVFDLGMLEDGVPFMVQEFVAGEGLDAILAREKVLPVDRVIRIGMQVAEAMAEAHAKGILHRDLKPENLRIQTTIQGDFVKVLDFGIARVEKGGTATNSFIGTPRYMAPEQIKQKDIDSRADVFALGVILFELLAGEPPIPAETDMEYIHLNLIAQPRDIRTIRADVPDALADLVDRMMAKEKSERPAGMSGVYEALAALPRTSGAPVSLSPSRPRTMGSTPVAATRVTPAHAGGTPAIPAGTYRGADGHPTVRPTQNRKVLLFGGAAAGAALLAVIVVVAVSNGSSATPATSVPTALQFPATSLAQAPLPPPSSAVAGSAAPATALPAGSAEPEPGSAAPDRPSRRRVVRSEPRTGAPATSAPRTAAKLTKLDD
jgi:serine/threonine-protein kinase